MIFRVSEVESYRQWRGSEDAEVSALLSRLRGEIPPTQNMLAGTAFHDVLEHAKDGELPEASAQGFHFIIEADITLALSRIREVRAHKDYPGIRVTGKLDVLNGLRVEDHKTTEQFNPERYLDGYQWRYYLDIFGADTFRWNVFEMKEVAEMTYLVHTFHSLEQCRYPNLSRDCERLAGDLRDFAKLFMPERVGVMELAA